MSKRNSSFLDALLTLPVVQAAKVSPNGKLVAWSWARKNRRTNVYVASTCGGEDFALPKQLSDLGNDTYVVSWSHDSKSLIVEADDDGNERVRLYQVFVGGHEPPKLLTDENPEYFIRGGDLSRDGGCLVYGANFDFETKKLVDSTFVYRHDLVGGERKLLAKPLRSPEKVEGNAPVLNSLNTHVLYFRADAHAAGQQAWLVRVDGSEDREILNFGGDRKVSACWLTDGTRIAFLAEFDTGRHLGVFDIVSGAIEWLSRDDVRNFERVATVPGSQSIVVTEVVRGREQAVIVNPDTGRQTVVASKDSTTVRPLARIRKGSSVSWLGLRYGSAHADHLVRFTFDARRRTSAATNVTRLIAASARTRTLESTFVFAEDFYWKSFDGLALHGFLYRARRARATVVYIHGGPRERSEDRFDALVQYLVSERFNVLMPNYRGSTGYGLVFQNAIKAKGWGMDEQEDIRSGIEALIRRRIARKGRVGVTGISYGGYSSWHAITHWAPELVAASAPMCGMTDLVVDYETTRPDLRTLSVEMLGGTPREVPEIYRERSPINFVSNIRGRLLIIQGGKDPNVTPENVRQVRVALKRAGVAYQLLEFDNEGHGVSKPENEALLFLSLSRFFCAM